MKFKKIISLSMASALLLNTMHFNLEEVNAEQIVPNESTTGSAVIPEAIIPEINFKPDSSNVGNMTSILNIDNIRNGIIKVYDENNNEISNGENISIGDTIEVEIIPNEFYSLKEVIINHKWYTDFTNNNGIYSYAYEVTQADTNIGANINMDIESNDASVNVDINTLITNDKTTPSSSPIWDGSSAVSINLNNTVVEDETKDNYLVIPNYVTDLEIIGDINTIYREVKIVREDYDKTLNITIENLKLTNDIWSFNSYDKSYTGVFDVATNTEAAPTSLTFKGENIIISNGYDAAINVPSGRGLEINSTEGTLTAVGSNYSGTLNYGEYLSSSGIGSGYKVDSGNITIGSGNITAYGNTGDNKGYSSGIGSGYNGDVAGTIKIEGGTINAYSSINNMSYGAGIGTSCYGDITGSIIINNGIVNAASSTGESANGAGIGTGSGGDIAEDGSIIINNGTVNAWSTIEGFIAYGAGIGTGIAGSIEGSIEINDGVVHSYSSEEYTGYWGGYAYGAGIGTGGYNKSTSPYVIVGADITETGNISINGGDIYARSAEEIYGHGAGIGTGGLISSQVGSGGYIYGSININNENDLYINSYSTKKTDNSDPTYGAGIGTGNHGSLMENGSINITNVDNNKNLDINAYCTYNPEDGYAARSPGIGAYSMKDTSSINITDATGTGNNDNFNIISYSVGGYNNGLTAGAPGIGARNTIEEGASINISYGNIEAMSGDDSFSTGASIGGRDVEGSINIGGGNLLLLNGGGGAAIGSSREGYMAGDINISDGNMILSPSSGAGIGSGNNRYNGGEEVTGTINITGGNIVFGNTGGAAIGQADKEIVPSKTGELNITDDAFVYMPSYSSLRTGIYMPAAKGEEENITIDENTLFLGASGDVQGLFNGTNEDLSDSYTKIKFDIENENGGDELIPYYDGQMKVINFSNNLFSLPNDFLDELLAKADMDRVEINEDMSNFNYSTNYYSSAMSSFNNIGNWGYTATKVFLKNGAWELNANDKDEKYFIESTFDLNDFVSLGENNTSILNVNNELVENSDYKMYLPNFKLISDSNNISAEETKVVRIDNDFEWVDTELTGAVSVINNNDIKVISAYKFDENGDKVDLNIIYGDDGQALSENDILFISDETVDNIATGNTVSNYIVKANNVDSDIHLVLTRDLSLIESEISTAYPDRGDVETLTPTVDIDRGDVETLWPTVDPDRGDIGTLTPTVDIDRGNIGTLTPTVDIDRGNVETLTPTIDPDRGEVETLTPTVEPEESEEPEEIVEPEESEEPEETEDNGSTVVEPTEPEVTEPEVTEPEVTEPETTEPETTEPLIPEATDEPGDNGEVIIEPEESEDVIELIPDVDIPMGNITLTPSESGIEDEYIIIDENGVPLGTVIAEDGNVENIVVDTFIPFGSPDDDRANPHTGMSNNKEIALLGLGGLMVVLARKKKMLGRKI